MVGEMIVLEVTPGARKEIMGNCQLMLRLGDHRDLGCTL